MKLSIVIPVYNGEQFLEGTVSDYVKYFRKMMKGEFEIFLVPNNCSDRTPEIAKELAKKYKGVRQKNFPYYTGKGGAVIEGFRRVSGDLIGYVDVDESTEPDAFYDLVKNIDDYDGVIASRWLKGAKVEPKQSFFRRVASRVFNLMIKILFGLFYSDTQCGGKVFRKKAVKSIVDDVIIKQWAFDIDLLYSMKKKGFKIKEIPTVWSDKGGSVLRVKKASWEMFKSIVKLRFYYSWFRRFLKI